MAHFLEKNNTTIFDALFQTQNEFAFPNFHQQDENVIRLHVGELDAVCWGP